ncbi:4-hydroxy-3-methylbut-2-enyl diphosphate reductase [Porphyridium purpureum]|uniref:4-hydroxy-3-methylbut-2-enyl diphosphate reductase n=1 Tax=Porphyridium purpureum TaxID=35688 RepID=A0A5J4YKT9_PORPP|nr:4-hydroxy-3-methylbut-2-enyl diphosphate reductase [Porphyridium purpureum]|eukprot:POR1645..scf249_10
MESGCGEMHAAFCGAPGALGMPGSLKWAVSGRDGAGVRARTGLVCGGARQEVRVRCRGAARSAVMSAAGVEADVEEREKVDKRAARREIMGSERFNRRGYKTTKEEVEGMMNLEFTSGLIQELRDQAYIVQKGDLTIKLAKAYGFCWGVERAVAIAYEARQQFPTQTLWLTNEVIHNPIVNRRLAEMGVRFVPQEGLTKDLTVVDDGDVVILPAFGATLEEMQYLNSRGVQIVDTTCPWVSKVWNALDKHQRMEATSIIHGKWKHEETVATASFADKFLIVLNMDEANYVADYILNGGDKQEFFSKFHEKAMSAGFDPDRDLQAIGIANQTTMLKGETEEIGKLFEKTMMKKYGVAEITQRFVAFNTICDATQERQDAMYDLIKEDMDLLLVIGGFNSSNTSHLQEIAEHANLTSYWVNEPNCIGPDNRILFRNSAGEEFVKEGFLPKGKVTIGVTSGASTPDKVVEDVLERVFMIHKLSA